MKDEEFFAPWAIANIVAFCDEILLVDNYSTDRTWPLLETIAKADPRIRVLRTDSAMGTNGLLQGYVGEDVWVFGVDGDEVYDPDGLARLRPRLLAGEFAAYWRLQGAMLHATKIDFEGKLATGHTSPEAKSVIKLFNFALLESWSAENQRLHGTPVLRDGHSRSVMDLSVPGGWVGADLRCLHMCFFPRSRADERVAIRHNLSDKRWSRRLLRAWTGALLRTWPWAGARRASLLWRSLPIKERSYAVGPLVAVDIDGFGRPTNVGGVGQVTEAQIANWSKARDFASDIRTSPGRRGARHAKGTVT